MAVKPYTIAVPGEALEKLSQRLALTTFPDQLDAEELWDLGTPVAEVKRLARYWQDGFDWKKAEVQMNELPNFMTTINVDGFGEIDIHCRCWSSRPLALGTEDYRLVVHQVSSVKTAIPLLFSHGCKETSSPYLREILANSYKGRAPFLK